MGPLFPHTYLVCRYYIWSSLLSFLPSFLFLTSFLPFSPDLPVLPRSPASFPISPCSARIPPFGCILLRISHPTAPLTAAIPGCVATAAARPRSPHAPQADPAATAHARRRLRSNGASARTRAAVAPATRRPRGVTSSPCDPRSRPCGSGAGRPRGSERRLSFCEWVSGGGAGAGSPLPPLPSLPPAPGPHSDPQGPLSVPLPPDPSSLPRSHPFCLLSRPPHSSPHVGPSIRLPPLTPLCLPPGVPRLPSSFSLPPADPIC